MLRTLLKNVDQICPFSVEFSIERVNVFGIDWFVRIEAEVLLVPLAPFEQLTGQFVTEARNLMDSVLCNVRCRFNAITCQHGCSARANTGNIRAIDPKPVQVPFELPVASFRFKLC